MHFKIEPISFQKKSVSLQPNRVDAVREQVTYFRRLNLNSVQAVINPTLNRQNQVLINIGISSLGIG
jgi:hypothetical protein